MTETLKTCLLEKQPLMSMRRTLCRTTFLTSFCERGSSEAPMESQVFHSIQKQSAETPVPTSISCQGCATTFLLNWPRPPRPFCRNGSPRGWSEFAPPHSRKGLDFVLSRHLWPAPLLSERQSQFSDPASWTACPSRGLLKSALLALLVTVTSKAKRPPGSRHN